MNNKKIQIAVISLVFLAVIICTFTSGILSRDAKKTEKKTFDFYSTDTCETDNGRVAIHDPSIVKAEDGTYYIFGSHGCAAKSTDLINWTGIACGINDNNSMLVPEGKTLREVLAEPLGWTDAYQTVNHYTAANWQTNIWAADVIYNKAMGKYCYYGSSSVWGQTASVIWFATSDNIEGTYEYADSIIYSGFNNLVDEINLSPVNSIHYSFTNLDEVLSKEEIETSSYFNENGGYDGALFPNCIDPAVFYDNDDNLWMLYGSYFGGIYIMPLCEETGLPDYEYMKNTEDYDAYYGKRLIMPTLANELSGEGAYITYDSKTDYYYLFVSYGVLNSLGGYNIREYRSKTVDGVYMDAADNSALDDKNTGTKLFGSYRFDNMETAYLAAGHSSCIETEDKLFQVYHTRFNNGTDDYEIRIHQMLRTQNGWAVVLPFEYSGETINNSGYLTEEICGEYEFINHGTISNGCTAWGNVEGIIAPTQNIFLNYDGTITGLKTFESIKENTTVFSRDVSGTWQVKEGTAYITFIIDGITYEGVLCTQKDESVNKTEKLVFSAVGENNECIWGVKK